jgi:hypothetical protein
MSMLKKVFTVILPALYIHAQTTVSQELKAFDTYEGTEWIIKNWDDAQQSCEAWGGELATPT